MNGNFDTNFYLAAATVIPLLYITLFLQGQMIQNFSGSVVRISNKFISFLENYASKSWRLWLWGYPAAALGGLIFALTVIAILLASFAGIIAEGISFLSLYDQSDQLADRELVLWSMFGLLVLAAANPTVTIIRNVYQIAHEPPSSDTSDERHDSTEGREQDIDAKTSSTTTKSSTGLGWPPSYFGR